MQYRYIIIYIDIILLNNLFPNRSQCARFAPYTVRSGALATVLGIWMFLTLGMDSMYCSVRVSREDPQVSVVVFNTKMV